ncbi:hypothetical protein ACRRTK_024678 [Alexandromys fortis]
MAAAGNHGRRSPTQGTGTPSPGEPQGAVRQPPVTRAAISAHERALSVTGSHQEPQRAGLRPGGQERGPWLFPQQRAALRWQRGNTSPTPKAATPQNRPLGHPGTCRAPVLGLPGPFQAHGDAPHQSPPSPSDGPPLAMPTAQAPAKTLACLEPQAPTSGLWQLLAVTKSHWDPGTRTGGRRGGTWTRPRQRASLRWQRGDPSPAPEAATSQNRPSGCPEMHRTPVPGLPGPYRASGDAPHLSPLFPSDGPYLAMTTAPALTETLSWLEPQDGWNTRPREPPIASTQFPGDQLGEQERTEPRLRSLARPTVRASSWRRGREAGVGGARGCKVVVSLHRTPLFLAFRIPGSHWRRGLGRKEGSGEARGPGIMGNRVLWFPLPIHGPRARWPRTEIMGDVVQHREKAPRAPGSPGERRGCHPATNGGAHWRRRDAWEIHAPPPAPSQDQRPRACFGSRWQSPRATETPVRDPGAGDVGFDNGEPSAGKWGPQPRPEAAMPYNRRKRENRDPRITGNRVLWLSWPIHILRARGPLPGIMGDVVQHPEPAPRAPGRPGEWHGRPLRLVGAPTGTDAALGNPTPRLRPPAAFSTHEQAALSAHELALAVFGSHQETQRPRSFLDPGAWDAGPGRAPGNGPPSAGKGASPAPPLKQQRPKTGPLEPREAANPSAWASDNAPQLSPPFPSDGPPLATPTAPDPAETLACRDQRPRTGSGSRWQSPRTTETPVRDPVAGDAGPSRAPSNGQPSAGKGATAAPTLKWPHPQTCPPTTLGCVEPQCPVSWAPTGFLAMPCTHSHPPLAMDRP